MFGNSALFLIDMKLRVPSQVHSIIKHRCMISAVGLTTYHMQKEAACHMGQRRTGDGQEGVPP